MSLIDPAAKWIDPDEVCAAADKIFWDVGHGYVEEALCLALDRISDKDLFYAYVKRGEYARAGELLGCVAEDQIQRSISDIEARVWRALEGK